MDGHLEAFESDQNNFLFWKVWAFLYRPRNKVLTRCLSTCRNSISQLTAEDIKTEPTYPEKISSLLHTTHDILQIPWNDTLSQCLTRKDSGIETSLGFKIPICVLIPVIRCAHCHCHCRPSRPPLPDQRPVQDRPRKNDFAESRMSVGLSVGN